MAMNKRHMVTLKRSCSCSMPGVWRAVAHNEGAAVIFHSPKACGHVAREMELGGQYSALARNLKLEHAYRAPLVTSNLNDDHSIFGGAEQLRGCIDFTMQTYKPAYVLLAASCLAGVIGDDVEAVAEEAEAFWKVPVMSVPCSGFLDGEYGAGFYFAAQRLIDRLMLPQATETDTVILLGDRRGPGGAEEAELQELLSVFGLRIVGHFPNYSSLEEIRMLPAASFCIPLGGHTQPEYSMGRLASYLEEKYGIPYLQQEYPSGWEGTKAWLKALGKALGREEKTATAIAKQSRRVAEASAAVLPWTQGRSAVLGIGRPLTHFQPQWVLEVVALAQMKLEGIILFAGLTPEQHQELRKALEGVGAPIVDEEAGKTLLTEEAVLLSTHEVEEMGLRQLQLPVLTPVGVGGLLEVLTKLGRLLKRSPYRGGVVYGW